MVEYMIHYSNLESSKRLQPILKKLGVKPDANYHDVLYHRRRGDPKLEGKSDWKLYPVGATERHFTQDDLMTESYPTIRAYRSDTLEDLLPEWCFAFNPVYEYTTRMYDAVDEATGFPQHDDKWNKLLNTIESLLWEIHAKRNSEKLTALTDLICLLWENGLLGEKK